MPDRPEVPTTWGNFDHPTELHNMARLLGEAINDTLRGRSNAVTTLTLTAAAATTTLTYRLIHPGSRFILTPTTANAAGALATTYFATPGNGSVVVNHANNAQTDRTFNVAILG